MCEFSKASIKAGFLVCVFGVEHFHCYLKVVMSQGTTYLVAPFVVYLAKLVTRMRGNPHKPSRSITQMILIRRCYRCLMLEFGDRKASTASEK